MKTLGIRVKPDRLIFAVYDSANSAVVNIETLKLPKALPVPESLKFARNTVLDILREYEIENAGMRIAETVSKKVNVRRTEIEGVVQEAFASSLLSSYFCGQISNISAKVGIPRADFKKYVSGELVYDVVEGWNELDVDAREALLVAIGALNA